MRENLTLAAHMKLGGMTWRERFQRVEQVIEVVSEQDWLLQTICLHCHWCRLVCRVWRTLKLELAQGPDSAEDKYACSITICYKMNNYMYRKSG